MEPGKSMTLLCGLKYEYCGSSWGEESVGKETWKCGSDEGWGLVSCTVYKSL